METERLPSGRYVTQNIAVARHVLSVMFNKRITPSCIATLTVLLFILPIGLVGKSSLARAQGNDSYDPRDFSGVWWVAVPGPEAIFARARNGDTGKCETCHPSEHSVPEPPLTLWAQKNVMNPRNLDQRLVMSADFSSSHVKPHGHACDPIGVPSQFWYTQLYPFELVVTADRIYQFFEKQAEWRVIWMNRRHPKNVHPTYMGDSVGKWQGNILIVDTIGFNGRQFIEPVGSHLMTPSFHLIETWRRPRRDEMTVDLTYFDKNLWGKTPWGGLTKTFKLQPGKQLLENRCTVEDNSAFDEQFVKPLTLPKN